MKVFILVILFYSSSALAEFDGFTPNEVQVAKKAQERLYPGGVDEDDLKVQESTKSIKPFVNVNSLMWKARRSAMGETQEPSQSN